MNCELTISGPALTGGNARAALGFTRRAYEEVTYHDEVTDTDAFIMEYGDFILAAFRGSRSLQDWIEDAQFWLVRTDPILLEYAHHGFNACADAVLPLLLRSATAGKPFVLVGHSLGGAVALLTAYYLARHNVNVHSVWTFGQPRVGDRHWALHCGELLEDKIFRFVNEEDIVPRLPGVLLEYRHCGTEIFFPSDARAAVINPSLLRKLWSDAIGLARGSWRGRLFELTGDHNLSEYAARLENFRPETSVTFPPVSVAPMGGPSIRQEARP